MNFLPKTESGSYKYNDKPLVLVVWRSWLWFSYGHREFRIKGFDTPTKPTNTGKKEV